VAPTGIGAKVSSGEHYAMAMVPADVLGHFQSGAAAFPLARSSTSPPKPNVDGTIEPSEDPLLVDHDAGDIGTGERSGHQVLPPIHVGAVRWSVVRSADSQTLPRISRPCWRLRVRVDRSTRRSAPRAGQRRNAASNSPDVRPVVPNVRGRPFGARSLEALVAYVRAAADRQHASVAEICQRIVRRHGVELNGADGVP
jgi:hypothetical protein